MRIIKTRRLMTAAGALVAVLVVGATAAVQSTYDVELSRHGVATVFMGDSITQAGTETFESVPSERSWVRYVVTDDRTPWRFAANVAVSGQTLLQMEERFDRDVLARRPRAVVISGGTNDVRKDVDLHESLDALRAMVERAQADGLKVWIVAPPPVVLPNGRPVAPMVVAQALLAAELDVPFLVVTREAVIEDAWRDGLSEDGIHPTQQGAEAIARAVLEMVN